MVKGTIGTVISEYYASIHVYFLNDHTQRVKFLVGFLCLFPYCSARDKCGNASDSNQVTPTAAPDLFNSLQQMADAAFAARAVTPQLAPSVSEAPGSARDPQAAGATSPAATTSGTQQPPSGSDEPNNKTDSQSRSNATNPMSVSVPNLTTNMDTVSLLESFAAVARRNLSANTNNMMRSSNASNFMRMALSATSNGKRKSIILIVGE